MEAERYFFRYFQRSLKFILLLPFCLPGGLLTPFRGPHTPKTAILDNHHHFQRFCIDVIRICIISVICSCKRECLTRNYIKKEVILLEL